MARQRYTITNLPSAVSTITAFPFRPTQSTFRSKFMSHFFIIVVATSSCSGHITSQQFAPLFTKDGAQPSKFRKKTICCFSLLASRTSCRVGELRPLSIYLYIFLFFYLLSPPFYPFIDPFIFLPTCLCLYVYLSIDRSILLQVLCGCRFRRERCPSIFIFRLLLSHHPSITSRNNLINKHHYITCDMSMGRCGERLQRGDR